MNLTGILKTYNLAYLLLICLLCKHNKICQNKSTSHYLFFFFPTQGPCCLWQVPWSSHPYLPGAQSVHAPCDCHACGEGFKSGLRTCPLLMSDISLFKIKFIKKYNASAHIVTKNVFLVLAFYCFVSDFFFFFINKAELPPPVAALVACSLYSEF